LSKRSNCARYRASLLEAAAGCGVQVWLEGRHCESRGPVQLYDCLGAVHLRSAASWLARPGARRRRAGARCRVSNARRRGRSPCSAPEHSNAIGHVGPRHAHPPPPASALLTLLCSSAARPARRALGRNRTSSSASAPLPKEFLRRRGANQRRMPRLAQHPRTPFDAPRCPGSSCANVAGHRP